jgi:hypothetical protein
VPVAPDDRRTPRLDQLKTLEDLMKTMRYSTKMPFEGYDKSKKTKGGSESVDPSGKKITSIEQRHYKLNPIHHYRLFKFTRKHRLFDAWLAGGEGAKLLRDTRQAAIIAARRD